MVVRMGVLQTSDIHHIIASFPPTACAHDRPQGNFESDAPDCPSGQPNGVPSRNVGEVPYVEVADLASFLWHYLVVSSTCLDNMLDLPIIPVALEFRSLASAWRSA